VGDVTLVPTTLRTLTPRELAAAALFVLGVAAVAYVAGRIRSGGVVAELVREAYAAGHRDGFDHGYQDRGAERPEETDR